MEVQNLQPKYKSTKLEPINSSQTFIFQLYFSTPLEYNG